VKIPAGGICGCNSETAPPEFYSKKHYFGASGNVLCISPVIPTLSTSHWKKSRMSHLKYYAYKGAGEDMTNKFGYSQSVNINGVIEISGQGGWYMAVHDIN
jgi:enamine deaminase RidA (YjgF/YER057c/UK114 family)